MYIVTGLTRMSQNRVCMSVFDTVYNCYRRPVFSNRQHITNGTIRNISLFSVIQLTPINGFQRINERPHLEDFPIEFVDAFIQLRVLNIGEQEDLLNNISWRSAYQVFGYQPGFYFLQQAGNSYFVNPNTGNNSLGTVEVRRARVYLNYYGRVRADFEDLEGNIFNDVAFVSIERDYWGNINEFVNGFIPEAYERMFVRLSLSRSYAANNEDPRRCYLQVSTIKCY